MERAAINAPDAPQPSGGYSQAVEIAGAHRTLFISGQIPLTRTAELPEAFADQCRQAWANVEAQLRAAGMTLANLVKVTIFLADRQFVTENGDVRRHVLGTHLPALTVIIAGIFDEGWLVEIEAVAVA